MGTLELDGVTKVFPDGDGEIVAVDDVDIEMRDGEFLVVVGPSGCGKSTTLRMVAGLETISSGEIRLAGQRVNEVKPQHRDIAMVFQSYALYPHMTVEENMAFGLEESTDLSDGEIETRVADAAETMGIAELLDRKPADLSGGQRQRVALGRAIVRDPEVFLMDEPLSNLDAKLRSEMRTELQRLQDELDVTTMYVTHDQTEAMTMGDRIAILNAGELQQVATPLECYHEPANRFVAGFIGDPSMNFFPVERDGETLVGDMFDYPLSGSTLDDVGDVTDLTLGVRPEDISLAGDSAGDHTFSTVVEVVEPMGDENTVYLRFADAPEGETFIATVGGLQQVSAGDEITVEIPEETIHLFDGTSGEAVHNREIDE
ncbi:ABC transporter ATP-binding protein [Halorubrum ezzemoulense]|uniref:ABC transporter ATP-binding protein n=1 Tax=Halorubrum ezzemoulense TaxID=337243 RepID=UPI000677A60D|nr:sn-glycerol-3-phosphate ABC transporter ATP-binding protein UgpC [Halorubrum ezzemoulense]MDB2225559.1 sn-glycerol-3-phosphate ABC transporter ATP-binding protein UgpC [Halorubrum ezzemoulense]MDB2238407.1 sn-glycerol-3-phosphate ABC transporter ATP-binding protein UgpC [Halorubrum ezzemoulense]MDB2247877.1 sn-glycerol-3-phosphate ABC transporter ATP-binding protein UgpC [Halorubrum ezzemoulense]MDB2260573.1 sn-glycerol-3-phosphate ABC transporter ATP-binding protein UgpC [Halorubrum ezzemou